jgi:antitoxin component YwqK of YwqJK toxin-antitoxin module
MNYQQSIAQGNCMVWGFKGILMEVYEDKGKREVIRWNNDEKGEFLFSEKDSSIMIQKMTLSDKNYFYMLIGDTLKMDYPNIKLNPKNNYDHNNSRIDSIYYSNPHIDSLPSGHWKFFQKTKKGLELIKQKEVYNKRLVNLYVQYTGIYVVKGFYSNEGYPIGLHKTFFRDGSLFDETLYMDSLNFEIYWKSYYLDGSLWHFSDFEKLEIRTYYQGGKIKSICKIDKFGREQGIMKTYSPKGELISQINYIDGISIED